MIWGLFEKIMSIDLGIIGLFILYSVTVGFLSKNEASKNLGSYFLAGRQLKGWQAGLSMAATQYAADTPLLVAGLVATYGAFSLWRLWIYGVAFLMMSFIFGPCWRRALVLTDAELTELRYSGRAASILRLMKAVHMGTLINCSVLAMVLLAATRISEQFLHWHLWLPLTFSEGATGMMQYFNFPLTTLPSDHPEMWVVSADNFISIGLIVCFTWLYSTTGGLRSVVLTDIVQFVIAMVATACYACIVITQCGGFEGMGVKLNELYGPESTQSILSLLPRDMTQETLLFLGVVGVQWFAQVNADGTGYLAQRMMACQNDEQAKKAGLIFTFVQVFLRSVLWLPILFGLLVLFPAEETPVTGQLSEAFRISREGSFVWGVRDLLPIGIRGLMITGLVAALASTVDTHLNWGASYWTNDFYKGFLMERLLKREASSKELVWIARLSNLGILVVALLFMRFLGSIQSTWQVTLLFGSGLGGVLILRWLWQRINVWSEVAAGVASSILAPVLFFGYPELSDATRLLLMTFMTTFLVIVVTLLTKPESEDTLKRFYERVQPPGAWKGKGELPKRKLLIGLMNVLIGAIVLFCLLMGVGNLMVNKILGVFSWQPILLISFGVVLGWVYCYTEVNSKIGSFENG